MQSFIKRIQGHELEFNRNIFPFSYNVSVKDITQSGITLSLQKDSKGMWSVSADKQLPGWLNEISVDIHDAIEKNEINFKETLQEPTTTGNVKKSIPNFPVRLSCLY